MVLHMPYTKCPA